MNNQNGGGEMVVLAFGIAIAWIALKIITVIVAMAAIGFTIVCFMAWVRPLKMGDHVLEPKEARKIVGVGILGAIAFRLFMTLVGLSLDQHYSEEQFFEFLGTGYCMGVIIASCQRPVIENWSDVEDIEILPPSQFDFPPLEHYYSQPPAPPAPLPAPKTRSFDFANWQD